MALDEKVKLISDYKIHDSDTGSSAVQCAILTWRIGMLTEHLKSHKKDHSSRRGLLKLVHRRRKLFNYLRRHSHNEYSLLKAKLGLKE